MRRWLAMAWLAVAVAGWAAEPAPPTVQRVPGLRGQAARLGRNCVEPVYPLPAGTTAQRGTVEFWFSPEDWDNRMTYDLQGPQYVIPLLRGVVRTAEGERTRFKLAAFRMSETKGGGLWVRHPLEPGQWYHVLLVWEGRDYQLFVNGEAADDWTFRLVVDRTGDPGAELVRLELGGMGWWSEFRQLSGFMTYGGQHTLVDEFRVYRRAFTPPERANAYRRFLPGAELPPLPFADAVIGMNNHTRQVTAAVELLAPEREQVTQVHLRLTEAAGAVLHDGPLSALTDGRATFACTHDGDLYGSYRGHFSFRAADGREVGTQEVALERPAPPWYGNRLGLHEGQVLPGWEPLRRTGGTIRGTGQEWIPGGCGWPLSLMAGGGHVLGRKVAVTLTTADGPVPMGPNRQVPRFTVERDDLIVSHGDMHGREWSLATRIATEFDGFMRVETTLHGPAGAVVTGLRIELPLGLAPEQFVGFWAGNPWFRAACDYRRLPAGEGVVFRSNATGRAQPEGWEKRVSFLPMLQVTDDWRGLCFLAENDQHWSQSWTGAAQEIVREGDLTILRLNLVVPEDPQTMAGPRTYAFALQALPVRPLAANARALARKVSFGAVDGFNGHTITARYGGHMDFRLAPEGMDWELVAAKAAAGRAKSPHRELYMYLDRLWQRAPEDALEYNRDWRGWGGATRYTPVVRDAYAWYLNEYLRRDLVQGFYIDDCWTKPTKGHPPSYLRPDGRREWGFEFYDYRDMLKRLRWLFHDHGREPLIWVHVTQTLYTPVFAFVDVLLDGEDRFVPWGQERDFIGSWGVDRIRFSNAAKSGLPTVWMNKIGNDLKPAGPMPKWFFAQQRAYVGLCAASDVWSVDDSCGPLRQDLIAAGCTDAQVRFHGYWTPGLPLLAEGEVPLVSLYHLPRQVTAVIFNPGRDELVATIRVDEAALREWLGQGGRLTIADADRQSPPTGEDIQDAIAAARQLQPEAGNAPTGGDATADQAFAELTASLAAETRAAQDPLAAYDHHNFTWQAGVLRLRVRAHDYRLLTLRLEAAAP